jgi:hypothetical protein
MKISIHQAEHFPWLGFFDKMKLADLFVILDHVQFTKNNFQNRNRIRNKLNDVNWLTIPVEDKSASQKSISTIGISKNIEWQKLYLEKVRHFYVGTRHFNDIFPHLQEIIQSKDFTLFEINMKIIQFIREYLNITTPMISSSSLFLGEKKSEMIVEICNKLRANIYISGMGGKQYLNQDLFIAEKIEVIYRNADNLLPYCTFDQTIMSSLDTIMRFGPDIGNSLGLELGSSELV